MLMERRLTEKELDEIEQALAGASGLKWTAEVWPDWAGMSICDDAGFVIGTMHHGNLYPFDRPGRRAIRKEEVTANAKVMLAGRNVLASLLAELRELRAETRRELFAPEEKRGSLLLREGAEEIIRQWREGFPGLEEVGPALAYARHRIMPGRHAERVTALLNQRKPEIRVVEGPTGEFVPEGARPWGVSVTMAIYHLTRFVMKDAGKMFDVYMQDEERVEDG